MSADNEALAQPLADAIAELSRIYERMMIRAYAAEKSRFHERTLYKLSLLAVKSAAECQNLAAQCLRAIDYKGRRASV